MTLALHHFPTPGSRPATETIRPPVVLLHGFTSSAQADYLATGWVEALHDFGHPVIALDLPGHGASPAITRASEATTSRVLAAIIDAVDEVASSEPFDVIGYSLGGRLAWDLPRHTDRVRKLVLGGMSPLEPFSAVDPSQLASALDGTPSNNPLVDMMAGMISAPGQDTASLARLIPGLASEPFQPDTRAPRVPTLLVAGDSDKMTHGIEELADLLVDGALGFVPGDHRGALDSAEFRAAALAFLNA